MREKEIRERKREQRIHKSQYIVHVVVFHTVAMQNLHFVYSKCTVQFKSTNLERGKRRRRKKDREKQKQ